MKRSIEHGFSYSNQPVFETLKDTQLGYGYDTSSKATEAWPVVFKHTNQSFYYVELLDSELNTEFEYVITHDRFGIQLLSENPTCTISQVYLIYQCENDSEIRWAMREINNEWQ